MGILKKLKKWNEKGIISYTPKRSCVNKFFYVKREKVYNTTKSTIKTNSINILKYRIYDQKCIVAILTASFFCCKNTSYVIVIDFISSILVSHRYIQYIQYLPHIHAINNLYCVVLICVSYASSSVEMW